MADIKFSIMRGKIAQMGLTYAEVAKELGIHESTFANKINGIYDWKLEEIVKLLTLFNMSFNDLFEI